MDFDLYSKLNSFAATHDWFEDILRFFAVEAEYLFIGMLALLFLMRGKWASRNARHGVIAAGLAAALALSLAHGISFLWERPRPYIAHPDQAHLFVPASGDPSFPSDHATAVFAIGVSLYLRSTRIGVLALAMAVIVAVSRVAVGVHYPGDILAGAAVGTAAAYVLWVPWIRIRLNRVADMLGRVYERVSGSLLGRPSNGSA